MESEWDRWAREEPFSYYHFRNYHSKGFHQVLREPSRQKESNVNHAPNYTAIETLKMTGGRFDLADHSKLIRKLAFEKDWDLRDIRHLADLGLFGTMMQSLLLRVPNGNIVPIYNFLGETLHNYEPAETTAYTGKHSQNKKIDAAAFTNEQATGILRGAATQFDVPQLSTLPANVRGIPIAIIGYGAAGILIHAALRKIGFHNATIFERSEDNLGIWKQKNVFQRSRNNPRSISFLGTSLLSAPGPGHEVQEFLLKLIPKEFIRKHQSVIRVIPKTGFQHQMRVQDPGPQKTLPATQENPDFFSYPIIINCIGLGKPAPVSDSDRMRTVSESQAGPRWQTTLDRETVHGKMFTFIGLGNSTAEMIRQIHHLQDQPNPPDVNYRILTHYPRDAVHNPDDYVDFNRKRYRVFRDLSQPNLVKFHGDLAEFRDDYYRALSTGKIISDVVEWNREGIREGSGILHVRMRDRSLKKVRDEVIHDDAHYTLIGYENTRDDIEAMGCRYDYTEKCALYDYDGEFHYLSDGGDPRTRTHKGYFGFGSVLKAPHNPNAIVIPGMVFRVGDLLFGVIMRAMEAARLKVI